MTRTQNPAHTSLRIARKLVAGAAGAAVTVLLLLWLAGVFRPKVAASDLTTSPPALAAGQTVEVRRIEVPAYETAVGTIRAVQEAAVAAEILARVVQVNVQAGQHVKAGEVLVRLDDEEAAARLREAEAVVAAAAANRDFAKIEFDRIAGLFRQQTAAAIEIQRADTALKDAEARLEQAQQAQRAAAKNLDNTVIRSPFDGLVVDKHVEVGDTVAPQRVLLTLYDPTRMQLVAGVRESLVTRLQAGQRVEVHIEAIDKLCDGTISEIVPQSDVASRTFLVKVTGPCAPEVHSGMFGRLRIPLDSEAWLVVPRAAIRHIGQLDLVEVVGPDARTVERRVVRLGRSRGDDVEVLAGLAAGERVILNASS